SLLGNDNDSIEFGGSYTDPGATATDAEDGDLTSAITIDSSLDTGIAGNYTITYGVTDSGSASASLSRTITVLENTVPVISLLGNDNDSIEFGGSYTDPGATATDAEDGDLSAAVTVETSLDTRFPGVYALTYRVTDSAGAAAIPLVRTVTVGEPQIQERADAFRFLQRATFGPTTADITALSGLGYEAWLDQQMGAAASLQLPDLLTRMIAAGYQTTDIQLTADAVQVQRLREDAWFETVLHGDDQLRQRVAFALSEILVVSWRNNGIKNRPQGLANYNDILVRNAFGNYRDLLQEVTLSPIMGHYLSMRRNEKANASQNILPDENYAREVMQLFSIGLDLLNADGTPQLDNNNQRIPAYTQQDILNFARVFTGWNYGDAPQLRSNSRTLQSELIPMTAFENYHDTDPKTLLQNQQLPGGRTAAADLESALDNIFNHPNLGPFIGKQLILKLITSNPTPEYVKRVAGVFADNGAGVRGDLGATVRAILMDPEALLGHRDDPIVFGKLKEPLLKFTALWRAFAAEGAVPGRIRFTNTDLSLGQEHLRAPSVFNFFQPDFSKPGELRNLQLLSPEFQILGESRAINMHNELRTQAMSATWRSVDINVAKNLIILNIEFEKTLANDPALLVDHLIDKLIGAPINTTTRNAIIDRTAQRALSDDGENRVEEALYLLAISPEFAVQH
ncbi:MAG: DUF1800 family protein, partial [Gammaproteobacteria bacterium]|nr:DUF1800 family protein [Gammaproteobacteria bacterium]